MTASSIIPKIVWAQAPNTADDATNNTSQSQSHQTISCIYCPSITLPEKIYFYQGTSLCQEHLHTVIAQKGTPSNV